MLVLLAVAAVVLPGLSQPRPRLEPVEVSVIIRESDSALWGNARLGMERAAYDLGADLRFITPTRSNDADEQELLLLREVERGSGALIVAPVHPLALDAALAEARVSIPIIALESPLEAAALGALGAFLLCIYNHTLTWKLASDCAMSTLKTVGMVFAVVAGTVGFGQMLAFTGAVGNLSRLALGMDVPPVVIIIITQIIVLILGFFIDVVPIMMMTIPIFYPIILQLGYDPIWFACLNLINMSMANITPPFGMILFVMKGVAPKGTTMQQIYSSVLPYVIIDALVIVLMILFPNAILVLPNAMYG
jgi:TRAP-type mannitol/chloroaromatic compound transport system permease large subunit